MMMAFVTSLNYVKLAEISHRVNYKQITKEVNVAK